MRNPKEFRRRLRQLCAEHGGDMLTIAKESGVNKTLLYEYLNGTGEPSVKTLEMLADYFGCSVDYFLGRNAPV